jgi:hypothetical protein
MLRLVKLKQQNQRLPLKSEADLIPLAGAFCFLPFFCAVPVAIPFNEP